MKIAIVGAGAVGCWYAALLARAGHDVTLQARGATLAALQARPLRVRSAVFGEADVAVRAVADPSEAAPVELVLLAVKSQGVASTLPSLPRRPGPQNPGKPPADGLGFADRRSGSASGGHFHGSVDGGAGGLDLGFRRRHEGRGGPCGGPG